MTTILTYDEVLSRTSSDKRHLLLGNGFSIACRPDLFRYDKLFDRANFSNRDTARKAFELLATTNFEAVMRALRAFAQLSELYAPGDSKAKQRAANDADGLREVLVGAVADSHPERPYDIQTEEYVSCRKFLRGYKSINTLNYDLLLYWTLMQNEIDDEPILSDDGFRKPADDPNADYVSWDSDNSKRQTIRYLHGALHLYDTGTEMKKYTWINTQIPLVDQIRAALEQEFYPVFVSEGTSAEKWERIRHNDYLSKMERGFTEIKNALIVFGHSLDECDDHIFKDRIGLHGKTNELYVSLLGDPASEANQNIIRRASAISQHRPERFPLDVQFFDAASASVWTDK
jgi:hypothetical protein